MLERLKNIWTWVSIVLLILCVLCYLLANPVLWVSEAPRTSNPWLTLLALVCLAFQAASPVEKAPRACVELQLGVVCHHHRNLSAVHLLSRLGFAQQIDPVP